MGSLNCLVSLIKLDSWQSNPAIDWKSTNDPVIMPPTTETEIKELRDLVIGLRKEIRVGFAQNDTKLSEFKAEIKSEIQRVEAKTDAKFAEVNVALANLSGSIKVLDERTGLGFWGFIGRAAIIGVFVLAIGFAIKYFLFGTVKL